MPRNGTPRCSLCQKAMPKAYLRCGPWRARGRELKSRKRRRAPSLSRLRTKPPVTLPFRTDAAVNVSVRAVVASASKEWLSSSLPYTNLQVAGGPPEHGRLLLSHSFDADATTARTETFTAASVRKGNVTGGLVRSRERLGARLRFLDFNSRPLALQGPQRRYALGIAF